MPSGNKYTVRALSAGMHLLEVIASYPNKTHSELAALSGLGTSQTYRLLHTLVDAGFAARGASKTYYLHARCIAVGYAAQRNHPLVAISRDVLDDLMQLSGASCHLVVREGLSRIIVDMRDSPDTVRALALLGNTDALYYGATGPTILAYSPPELVEAVLDGKLERRTPRTLTERSAIKQMLAEIRQAGYRVAREDFALGAYSVAAPIFDEQGNCDAAICVYGAIGHLTPATEPRFVELVQVAAAEVSRRREAGRAVPDAF